MERPIFSAVPVSFNSWKSALNLRGIVRIGELADKIGCTDQAGLGVGLLVVLIVWNGEPGQFDGARNPIAIEQAMAGKSLPDSDLSARDMVGSQDRVAGTARKFETLSGFVDDDTACIVRGAGSPDEADVVAQQCKDEVRPVLWFHRVKKQLSTYDLLADLCHQDRMFHVVVERVAGAYSLDQQPGPGIDQRRKFRFPVTVIVPVGIGQFLAECFCR